jgi:hypothetical protein
VQIVSWFWILVDRVAWFTALQMLVLYLHLARVVRLWIGVTHPLQLLVVSIAYVGVLAHARSEALTCVFSMSMEPTILQN